MAYTINTNNGFQLDASPISGTPLSIFARFNSTSSSAGQRIITISHLTESASFHALAAWGPLGGDPLLATSRDTTSGTQEAATSSGYSTNTWHAGLAVFAADNDRSVYIDGGSKGTDSGTASPNLNETSIGFEELSTFTGNYFQGALAELAIWDAALSDDDALVLNTWSPEFVKPANLVWYWDAIRQTRVNRGIAIGTTVGSPAVAAHDPTVIYRPRQFFVPVAATGIGVDEEFAGTIVSSEQQSPILEIVSY